MTLINSSHYSSSQKEFIDDINTFYTFYDLYSFESLTYALVGSGAGFEWIPLHDGFRCDDIEFFDYGGVENPLKYFQNVMEFKDVDVSFNPYKRLQYIIKKFIVENGNKKSLENSYHEYKMQLSNFNIVLIVHDNSFDGYVLSIYEDDVIMFQKIYKLNSDDIISAYNINIPCSTFSLNIDFKDICNLEEKDKDKILSEIPISYFD